MGRPKKYSDDDKERWRAQYEKSRGGNLTTFGAMIGDQFSQRVNVLAQIIRDSHEYSLGRYKEKLLSRLIAESIPGRYAVGTGFVLFPRERLFAGVEPPSFDNKNRADHEVSRQCDIIVYDRERYPVVFQDDDFVVVLPEATRAIVEVKGTLNSDEIKSSTEHLIDFGKKWQQCDRFYRTRHNPYLHDPTLFVLAWQIGINRDGTPQSDGVRFQQGILEQYKALDLVDFEAFPYLSAAYIYNDTEISSSISFEEDEMVLGFHRQPGKLHYYDESGNVIEAGDGTISGLISRINASLATPFNRFVAYKDEARSKNLDEFKQRFCIWLRETQIATFNWPNRK